MVAAMVAFLGTEVPTAVAQEGVPSPEEMERLERGMELEARKIELGLKQEMAKLELEARRAEIERHRHGKADGGNGGAFILLVIITNILLTVWVFKDMHEQKIGRALWVPIVLLAGVFGAILYAIVRVADTRGKAAEA
jgi:hypothetical protein